MYRYNHGSPVSKVSISFLVIPGQADWFLSLAFQQTPGIYQAKVMAETGKSFVVFDRYHKIGGVWEFYGNECSRVNTSEILALKFRSLP